MEHNENEEVRARLFALIESTFGADARFERAVGLPSKTVNNWRRGLSASYMKMLPRLAGALDVPVSSLLGAGDDFSDLSASEVEILSLYRAAENLSASERTALTETIKNTIGLYLSSHGGKEK